MPHDRDGREIRVGDRVTMEFEVTTVAAGDEYCNMSLKSVLSMPPYSDSFLTIHAVNTRQCLKIHGTRGSHD
jgi:hypothetical protein